jgi:hypothetical protein
MDDVLRQKFKLNYWRETTTEDFLRDQGGRE